MFQKITLLNNSLSVVSKNNALISKRMISLTQNSNKLFSQLKYKNSFSLNKSSILPTIQTVRFNSNDAVKTEVTEEVANAASNTEFTSSLPDFSNNAASNITDAVSSIPLDDTSFGYLKSIGMAEHPFYWLPDTIQQILELEHVYLDIKWGAAIVLTTILYKMALVPLQIKQSEVSVNLAKFQAESKKYNDQMYDKDLEHYQKMQTAVLKLKEKNGLQPGQMKYVFLPMVCNAAFALSLFTSLRQMCAYPVSGFENGGWLWFENLVNIDQYLGLQILSSASIFLYTKYVVLANQDMMPGAGSNSILSSPKMQKVMKFLPFLSIPFTMSLSSGVVLYITASTLSSFIFGRLVRNDKFRVMLGYRPFPKREEILANAAKAAGDKPQGFRDSMKQMQNQQLKKVEFQKRMQKKIDEFEKMRSMKK
ncbi:hypothetical protein ACO0SA_004076 [Hanseniaspora valbyensis]